MSIAASRERVRLSSASLQTLFPEIQSETTTSASSTHKMSSSSSNAFSSSNTRPTLPATSSFETTFSLFPDVYTNKSSIAETSPSSPSSSPHSAESSKSSRSSRSSTKSFKTSSKSSKSKHSKSKSKPHRHSRRNDDYDDDDELISASHSTCTTNSHHNPSKTHSHRHQLQHQSQAPLQQFHHESKENKTDQSVQQNPLLLAHRTQFPLQPQPLNQLPIPIAHSNSPTAGNSPQNKVRCGETACSHPSVQRCDMETCNRPLCTWHARKSLFTGHFYCSECVQETTEGKILSLFSVTDIVHGDTRPDRVISNFHEAPHWVCGQGSSNNSPPPTALTESWLSGVNLPGSDPTTSDCIIS